MPDLCEGYVKDTNLLKTLRMDKEISFDFSSLSAMIHGYIRSLGWRRGLSVSFPKANHTVRVWSRNKLSAMWENCCCNVLCHITIIPVRPPSPPPPPPLPCWLACNMCPGAERGRPARSAS